MSAMFIVRLFCSFIYLLFILDLRDIFVSRKITVATILLFYNIREMFF